MTESNQTNMVDTILNEMNQPGSNLDQIIDKMLENETRLETLYNEIADIEVEQSELKKVIKEQWELTQTKGMCRGNFKLDLKPFEKWSINLENVDTIVPLLEEIGQNGVIKRTVHHQTLNRVIREIIEDNTYTKEQLLELYPGLKHFQGNVLKIKKIEK